MARSLIDVRRMLALQQAQEREERGDSPAERPSGLRKATAILESSRPATWVFTGDTIVQGAGQTGAGRTFSEHFGDHLRFKLRRLLDVVINTGVPNSRAENFLKSVDWRVNRFSPDVVFLMLGASDAAAAPAAKDKFHQQLIGVLDALKPSSPVVILQTPPTPRPDRWAESQDLMAHLDVIRDVADERSLALIDHWALFEEQLSHAESAPDWWSAGGLLPNVRGHVELARQVIDAVCREA